MNCIPPVPIFHADTVNNSHLINTNNTQYHTNVNKNIIDISSHNCDIDPLLTADGIQLCIDYMSDRITQSLHDMYDYDTAIFMAEQLLAMVQNYCKHYASNNNNQHDTLHTDHLFSSVVYTLALCHYHNHSINRCYAILDRYKQHYHNHTANSSSHKNIYLMASCAYKLQLYRQCEFILIGNMSITTISTDTSYDICHQAAGWLLLAKTCGATGRNDNAIRCYQRCLELDNTNWSAYSALCELGVNYNASKVYNIHIDNDRHNTTQNNSNAFNVNRTTTMVDKHGSVVIPSSASRCDPIPFAMNTPSVLNNNINAGNYVTPANGTTQVRTDNKYFIAPSRPVTQNNTSTTISTPLATRASSTHNVTINVNHAHLSNVKHSTLSNTRSSLDTEHETQSETARNERKLVRRSTRVVTQSSVEKKPKAARIDNNSTIQLHNNKYDNAHNTNNIITQSQSVSTSTAADIKHNDKSTPFNTTTPAHTPIQRMDLNTPYTAINARQPSNDNDINGSNENIESSDNDNSPNSNHTTTSTHVSSRLSNIFQCLCESYRLLSLYQCKSAVQFITHHIAAHYPMHYNTGVVLCWLGKAYLELADYKHAITSYQQCRRLESDRLSGMEYYSTALWHSRAEIELSYLAQQCISFDKYSYISWMILGNCYSLQKDHETALKYFHRAQQLNPFNAYSYTLSAHEHVATEEYDKAISDYRHAISIDARHYNAWYGIGVIYNRQEQWNVAIYHFKHAITINRSSSVLYCYLGMSYFGRQQYDQALSMFNMSEQYDPYNPMPQYQRAQLYVQLHRYNDALQQLNKLHQIAPKEASIYHLQAKIYKQQNQSTDALVCWIHAMDCDVKDRLQIKHAFDKLHTNNNDAINNNQQHTNAEL